MSIRIASIQLNSQTDIDANLDVIGRAIADVSSQADVVVLPENMCVMGRQNELATQFEKVSQYMGQLAKDYQIHLVAGTLPCPIRPDGTPTTTGKFRQSSLVFTPSGIQIARYDKIHLFCATVNDSTGSYDEGKVFESGEELVVIPLNINEQTIHLGMMICFDVRFAVMAQQLRNMGADIISVPAAFTHRTGQAHWQLLLQARALDSQCMMIGSTQGGVHHIGNSTRETWGHALITNAHGQVIANSRQDEMGGHDYLAVFATFDKDEQDKIRQNMPIFNCHRLS